MNYPCEEKPSFSPFFFCASGRERSDEQTRQIFSLSPNPLSVRKVNILFGFRVKIHNKIISFLPLFPSFFLIPFIIFFCYIFGNKIISFVPLFPSLFLNPFIIFLLISYIFRSKIISFVPPFPSFFIIPFLIFFLPVMNSVIFYSFLYLFLLF